MSVKEGTIWCDALGCVARTTVVASHGDAALARLIAKEERHWTCSKITGDLCPYHARAAGEGETNP